MKVIFLYKTSNYICSLIIWWIVCAFVTSKVLSIEEDLYHDHLLCLNCGSEIADVTEENFFNITSPLLEAKHYIKPTKIFVQFLTNPSGVTFQVLSLRQAGCIGIGEWYSEHTWFPNYSWQICLCPHCKAHIGWIFKLTETLTEKDSSNSTSKFFGLVWDTLIRETFSDSLLVGIPKSQKW